MGIFSNSRQPSAPSLTSASQQTRADADSLPEPSAIPQQEVAFPGWRLEVLTVVLYLTVYIAPLGFRPLFDPDEIRYGEIPREMLECGDWVVPRVDSFRYFEKPPVGYWLNALSIWALGPRPFAVRLSSALSAGGVALLLCWLISRFGPGRRWGGLAALALLFCPMFFGIGVFAVLDMPFTFFLTGTWVFLYAALHVESMRSRIFFWFGCGIFCAMAFLTKGFLGFALPGLSGLVFLSWQRLWGRTLHWCWLPILAIVLVVAPWAIAIHLREPDFWRYFVVVEHIQRFLHAPKSQHPRAWWYFVPMLTAGILPWVALLPASWRGIRESIREPLASFALCWFGLPFLFLSASSGKLATYILPCFPPVILLIFIGLWKRQASAGENIFRRPGRLASGVTLLLVVGIWGMQLFGNNEDVSWHVGEYWKLAVLTVGLLSTCVCYALAATSSGSEYTRAVIYGSAICASLAALQATIPEHVLQDQCPSVVLRKICPEISPSTTIASEFPVVQAACWQYKRSDILLVDGAGELTYGADYPDCRSRHLTWEDLAADLRSPRDKDVILFGKTKHIVRQMKLLPTPSQSSKAGRVSVLVFNSTH